MRTPLAAPPVFPGVLRISAGAGRVVLLHSLRPTFPRGRESGPRPRALLRCGLGALLLGLLACGVEPERDAKLAPAPDLLLTNGRIYTLAPEQPWVEALAIGAGRILAVGSTEAMLDLAGPQTRALDLAGRFAMPGINDGHAHPAWGGVTALYYCLFPASATPLELMEKIQGCIAETSSEETWIQGGMWTPKFFAQYRIASPRAWLDRISGDKAVALKDDSGHNYWVNSKALNLLGLDAASEPPPGGVFVKDERSGELNGLLLETFTLLTEQLPEWKVSHYREGVRYAARSANRFGVTGFKDASASPRELQAYYEVDQAGELTVHVAACLFGQEFGADAPFDVAALQGLRERYASEHLHTGFVKIFLDGVPTTARTAAMLAPYVPAQEGEAAEYGPLHVQPKTLQETLIALDRAGFTVKIHTAGDRSVHEGLNAVEAARQANGDSGLRHELGHAGFIDPSDIPRFAELGVVADLSPYLWFPSPIIESVREAVGERGFAYWPNRDLLDSGAPLLAGSDWPSVAEDLNPWVGMEALVTRRDPFGVQPGAAWPEQALTVREVVKIFTSDGARALGLGDETGSLRVGKSADLIVLNHDIFAVPAERISDTEVQLTFFAGAVVHDASTAPR